jgi:ADP-ribose pyrophosphatase YjhB (NUDIX family)
MKFAPREVFEQILEWAMIPTFDLIIKGEEYGYLFVRRTISSYKNQRALPGLRMYKDEGIDDTILRIAKQEVGITLDATKKILIGQYVGKRRTEHQRPDLSRGYYFNLTSAMIPNQTQ